MAEINTQYLPASFYANGQLTVPKDKAEAVAAGIQARAEKLPPAERAQFLSLLANGAIAPSANLSTAEMTAALDRLEAAAVFLATPAGRDFASMLAELMIEQAASMKKSALDSRVMALDAQRSDQLQQAGKMRDSAAESMKGALISLVVGVVTSAIAVIGSSVASFKQAKNVAEMKAPTREVADATKMLKAIDKADLTSLGQIKDQMGGARAVLDQLGNQASRIGTMGSAFQGVGSAGSAASGASSGIMESKAKTLDAEGQELAAKATDAQAKGELAKELQTQLEEMVKALIDFIKSLREAEVELMAVVSKG